MDRFALPAAYLAMQAACWSGAALVAGHWIAAGDPRGILSLPVALLTLLLGCFLGRHLLRRDLEPGTEAEVSVRSGNRAPVVALALGTVWSVSAVWAMRHLGGAPDWILALPWALARPGSAPFADPAALLLVLVLWWIGLRTGARTPEHEATVRAFGTGAMALSAALLVSVAAGKSYPALPLSIVLFILAGLPALSMARLRDVRRDLLAGTARGEPSRLDGSWSRALLPPMAAILGAALAAGWLVGDPAWQSRVRGLFSWTGEALFALLYWPILLVGLAAEWLIYLLRRLQQSGQQEIPPPPPSGAPELLAELQRTTYAPPGWMDWIKWIVVGLAALLAVYAFLSTARAVQRGQEERLADGIERSSVWSWQQVGRDLRSLLRQLINRLRGQGAAAVAALPWLGSVARSRALAAEGEDPRAVYRRVLLLGRAHNLPRRASQTPHEYLASWQEALPGGDEAARITAAYSRARYGPARVLHEVPENLTGPLGRLERAVQSAAQSKKPAPG